MDHAYGGDKLETPAPLINIDEQKGNTIQQVALTRLGDHGAVFIGKTGNLGGIGTRGVGHQQDTNMMTVQNN